MAGAYKRASDRAKGKSGKYTAWWIGADGKKHSEAGSTSKEETEKIARERETEAKLVKAGVVDPGARTRRQESLKPVADHAEDYRLSLLDKGDTAKHVKHIKRTVVHLLADASVESIADMRSDRIQGAIGRLKQVRSARTCNHALRAVRAFATWLHDSGRIKEFPIGLRKIPLYSEAADRRYVRRPLSLVELERLLAAARLGETVVTARKGRGGPVASEMTGADRAMAYWVAMSTGFRAEEIRTLTPERFQLEGESPTITVEACYSKRGKKTGRDDVQPIRRDVADVIRPWLAIRAPGKLAMPLPEKAAEMLAVDLAAAGINPTDEKGRVVDFHALRHSYITAMAKSGMNPKTIQILARHSTITLTLDRYTTIDDEDVRRALDPPCTSNEQPTLSDNDQSRPDSDATAT